MNQELDFFKRKFNLLDNAERIYLYYKKYKKPISRSLQRRDFFESEFIIENTLDPRPETEELVELILDKAKNISTILDLGTGSGCIILSIMKRYKRSTGIGIDICNKAIETARRNAKLLGIGRRVKFIRNNWLDNFNQKFDLIISNPPYVEDIINEELKYDPQIALIGNINTYKNIIKNLHHVMHNDSIVAFEINENYGNEIIEILSEYSLYGKIYKDLANKDRFIIISSFSYAI